MMAKTKGIHEELLYDLLDAAMGVKVQGGPWGVEKYAMSHLRGEQRSVNYGIMARATAMLVDPSREIGGLTATDSWRALDLYERQEGHRQGELRGEYEAWNGLGTMIALATIPSVMLDDVANIMRRELLLFAVGCHRAVQRNSRKAVIYSGYGFRSAGLRKMPWAWDINNDDYLYSKMLDLPMSKPPVRRGRYHEVVDEFCTSARARLGSFGAWLRTLALAPNEARGALTAGVEATLRQTLETMRTQSAYEILRGKSQWRASFIHGPIRSRQTACTRAIIVRSPEKADDEVCYPYRRDPERKWGRNRKGKTRVGAGGSTTGNDGEGAWYEAWNEAPLAEKTDSRVFIPAELCPSFVALSCLPNRPALMRIGGRAVGQ